MSQVSRILIVDDDPLTIKLLQKALEGMGDVYSAPRGTEALAWLAEHPVELVLLDIIMPELDGFATSRALHQDYPDLPVIFVTAACDAVSEIEALAVGGFDFISKPIHPLVVRARVALQLRLKESLTARQRTEDQLRNTKELLEATLSALPDRMLCIDRAGIIHQCHCPWFDQLPLPPASILGKRLAEVLPAEASHSIQAALEAAATTGKHHGAVYSLPTPHGLSWYELSIAAMRGRVQSDDQFIVLIRDITERKQHESELVQARDAAAAANQALQAANAEFKQLATTDTLTGAWNRLYFEEVIAAVIARAHRYGESLSLLMYDIDSFKSINDRHGHQAGDQILSGLTQRVRRNLRAADVLVRWGGEEFLVLAPLCTATDALNLAEKLRTLVATRPFSLVGTVTASFGVAELRPGESLDGWLKRADDALYAAKSAGRNRVRMTP